MAAAPYFIQFEQTGNALDGYLTSTQFLNRVPFEIKRVFWIHGTPPTALRGQHANKKTEEVLIALHGGIKIKTESVNGVQQFELTSPGTGLYIPALCWTELAFQEGTIALCLASTEFDEADYIRDYAEFHALLKE